MDLMCVACLGGGYAQNNATLILYIAYTLFSLW